MRCSACGTESSSSARFCAQCGASLARACPRCGHEASPAARFCQECGSALDGPPAGPAATPAPSPLEGERKQITVLFADVVSSTEIIQDLDPEEAQRLLDGAVQAMMDAVHRYQGTVSRLMGDGLMALFGAPVAHEDHALRACYAALAMQDGVRRYADDAHRRHGIAIQIRVGLNSGPVIVRLLSDDLHRDYTAMGPTVHLAARVEQLARPGTTLLTASTLALAAGFVQVQPLGLTPIRGIAEPVETYTLTGAEPSRRRFQATTTRGLTRFVGREAELAALQRAAERAGDGQGQIVALVGEPGIGKSRLVHEIVQATAGDESTPGSTPARWLVLEGGAVSYGRATPWLPVVDLLKRYCGVEPRDDPETAREQVMARLLGLDDGLRPLVPAVLTLLDVPVDPGNGTDEAAWAALDPAQRRRQTLDAVRRLLLRESREQPLLLVFEDLHWIDGETQALLDTLVESLPGAAMLLLVNYRPEYAHGWSNKSYYSQVQIDRLVPSGAAALLAALVGDALVRDGSFSRLLLSRAEGNPFFLEECVRSLVETGILVGEAGAYRLARNLTDVEVPATVQATLAARIDWLPAEEKRLLQTAAVVGKDVPYALLRAIVDAPPENGRAASRSASSDEEPLLAGLGRLQAAEFLYEASLFPELEYTFKHALTHEVAYGSLMQDRRRALHARIVQAIEALYPDRLDEHAERLAHHALRGELWEQAVAYCRQAGHRAMARSALQEAVRFFEQALAAFERLPPGPETVPFAIDLRFDLRNAHWSLQQFEPAHEIACEAEALAEAAGDRARPGRALTFRAHYLRATVDHRKAVEIGERAIAIADELGDIGMRIAAVDVMGASSFEMGRFDLAIDQFRRSLALLAGEAARASFGQSTPPAVHSRIYLAFAQAWQGRFQEAVETTDEGIRISEALDNAGLVRFSTEASGLVAMLKGDTDRAIPILEQTRPMLYITGTYSMAGSAFLGYAYALVGRGDEAVAMATYGLDLAAARGFLPCTSLWTGYLAGGHLAAGRVAEAERAALRAVEMARTHQERGFEGEAHYRLGEVVLQIEPLDAARAERHFRDALAIAEELGMRPLQAHCHLGLGKLYRKCGQLPEARAALDVAIDLYLSMEMAHWIPEAEAELARVLDESTAERTG